jgi:trans-2,3-dihydro-3-hydroxyanthranilate isomerase
LPRWPFLQVDAFTDRPLGGNPCAVVLDADDLDDATMQAVAREMNLSETAFVRRSRVADFGVRDFTPAAEIPMAGHPTLATVWALVESGRIDAAGQRTELTLELRVGPLRVEVLRDAGPPQIVMTQPRPHFGAMLDAARVLAVFGLGPEHALAGAPVQVVSTGTPQLMVPLRGPEALRALACDARALGALRDETDFFSVHLFCLGGATSDGHTFARHFAAPPNSFEDPFTGSATGAMGAYLWQRGLLESPRFLAEQGHWMGRPGRAQVEVLGPREAPEAVRVGGGAATVVRGELRL